MSTPIRAIIVDDEASARNVLSRLLERYCPQIEVLQQCCNVPEALDAIHLHQPQVVFLDIEMPNYAGFEIVRFFEKVNFEIIFITAYDHYAIKAFEIAAIDYLLKPIEIARLQKAVAKLEKKMDANNSS